MRDVKINRIETRAQLIGDIRIVLERSRRVVVITHIDPDGDAIGTQLAFGAYLRALGKDVVLVHDSEIPQKYMFLPEIDRLVKVDRVDGIPRFDTAVVLECPNADRMGAASRFLAPGTAIINIDHHPDSAVEGDVSWVDVTASSVGEMAYEFFAESGFKITHDVATQLYAAILTDTGRFRFESTTPRALVIAGELVAAGADPRTICDRIYFDLEPATMLLTARVLNSIEYFADGQICVIVLSQAMLAETGAGEGSTEGLVDYTLYTKGVLVGVLLKEGDGKGTKVSLRSRGDFNVAAIASRLGGGGHFNAAGGRLPMDLARAKNEIVRILKAEL